jgi:hypothetical protein
MRHRVSQHRVLTVPLIGRRPASPTVPAGALNSAQRFVLLDPLLQLSAACCDRCRTERPSCRKPPSSTRTPLGPVNRGVLVQVDLTPGSLITIPGQTAFTFEVLGESARFLGVTGGDRADKFFADFAASVPAGQPFEEVFPRIAAVTSRHGVSVEASRESVDANRV